MLETAKPVRSCIPGSWKLIPTVEASVKVIGPGPPLGSFRIGIAPSRLVPLLFQQVKNEKTPVMVERVVADIDEIVRLVRFPGWQNTAAGEREVKKALRKSLLKYQLHQDIEQFDRAYGYIKQYY